MQKEIQITNLDLIIRNHIFSLSGSSFQHLCNRLLLKEFPEEFVPTRSGGVKGDLKNDGYCYFSKIFFQCHGTRGQATSKLKNKITEDLTGCLKYHKGVSKFIFITNDTNLADIEDHLQILRVQFREVIVEPWGIDKLSLLIQKYSIEEVEYILGFTLPIKIFTTITYRIKYEMKHTSIREFKRKTLQEKGLIFIGLIICCIACVVTPLWLLFKKYLDFNTNFLYIPFLAILPGIVSISYFEYFRFWIEYPNENRNEDPFILRRFVNKKKGGDCITYIKSAPCAFDNCSGIVYPNYPPERERSMHTIIGQCNKNENLHTYTYEREGYGNYQKMNFDPVEKSNKK
jgi:hypothetical protein